MDTDASGALSLRELTAALIAHGAGLGADWVPGAIRRALETYDTDGDGELDRAEFAAALADLSGGEAERPADAAAAPVEVAVGSVVTLVRSREAFEAAFEGTRFRCSRRR
jgi:hypothetical protein